MPNPIFRSLEPDDLIGVAEPAADFLTHLHYVECLSEFTENLRLDALLPPTARATNISPELVKKVRLAKLTYDSLRGEFAAIAADQEYAVVCVTWVAVKAYYLTFYMEMIVYYLFTLEPNAFRISHTSMLSRIDSLLGERKIGFNIQALNMIHNSFDIEALSIPSGSNLVRNNPDMEVRIKQILKKINQYKKEQYLASKGIVNLRTVKSRVVRDEYIATGSMSLTQFFYWYRIKANYRDLSFLDQDVASSNLAEYFNAYFKLTDNYYTATSGLIDQLSEIRTGNRLFS